MLQKNYQIREQIVKTVVKSGNGGAVWVPKNWLGEEVIVTLPKKEKKTAKEEVLDHLEPYLKDIESVGIYGSHARKEASEDSDIDVIVISDKNLKINPKKGMDILVIKKDKIEDAIKKHPTTYYNIIHEAEPIINHMAFDDAKKISIKKSYFDDYIKDSIEHLKSSRELLDLDKLDGDILKSFSVLYSLMLRLRGLFIQRRILKKKRFSNKEFKEWLGRENLSRKEINECYEAYRCVREGIKPKQKIKISVIEKLIGLLERELK